MRPGFALVFFLVAFVSCSSGNLAPNGAVIHDSTDAQRHLRSSEVATTDEEERALAFSGLNKLKNLIRGNAKTAVRLEKSSVIKEIEALKKNPAIVKGLKSVSESPVVMKRLSSLEKMDPKVVASLRRAPVNQVSSYLSRGQPRHISPNVKGAIAFISLIFFGFVAPIGLVALITSVVQ